MKELPISMVPDLVLATMDLRKTNTRRPKQPQENSAPYHPGDLLYIRESTRLIDTFSGCTHLTGLNGNNRGKFQYKADGSETGWVEYPERLAVLQKGKCVPNGCYKELARIWLKITEVREERLQDITEEEAKAEGVESSFNLLFRDTRYKDYLNTECNYRYPTSSFQSLWESIYGVENWKQNPIVWVVKYDLISTTGRAAAYAKLEEEVSV